MFGKLGILLMVLATVAFLCVYGTNFKRGIVSAVLSVVYFMLAMACMAMAG